MAWFTWPALASLALAIPAMTALASVTAPDSAVSFVTFMKGMGAFFAPADEHAFEAIAIVATVIVAVAAVTGFVGDWRDLDQNTRIIFRLILWLCLLTLGGVVSASGVATFNDVHEFSRLALIFMTTWVVALVTTAVMEVVPAQERLRAAKADWRARRKQATAIGVTITTHVPIRARVTAELAFWGIPLAVWVSFAAVFVGGDFGLAASILFSGNLMMMAAARSFTEPTAAHFRVARAVATSLAAFVPLALITVLAAAGVPSMAVALGALTGIQIIVMCTPWFDVHLPWMRTLVRAKAVFELHRARSTRRRARRRVRNAATHTSR